jgi:hypothetical protein
MKIDQEEEENLLKTTSIFMLNLEQHLRVPPKI